MSETTSSNSATPALSVPVAIIIAGAFIALAVYFSGARTGAPLAPAPDGAPVATGQAPAQPTPGAFRPVDDTDHVRGALNGAITIIEYSDLECPFCKQYHATLAQIMKDYPNDVRWVYRHAPLAQLHSKAPAEANAAECAGEQGKFWEFVDEVFATSPTNNGLDLATLPDIAKRGGVSDIAKFNSCVESNKYASLVDDQLQDSYAAGLRGTPFSVIMNKEGEKKAISGAQPIASIKVAIDSLLE